jgi:hypothetical protein
VDKSLDEGNDDFQAESSSDDKLSDKDSDVEEITNEEVYVLHNIFVFRLSQMS